MQICNFFTQKEFVNSEIQPVVPWEIMLCNKRLIKIIIWLYFTGSYSSPSGEIMKPQRVCICQTLAVLKSSLYEQ
jgi:hypothetical protein